MLSPRPIMGRAFVQAALAAACMLASSAAFSAAASTQIDGSNLFRAAPVGFSTAKLRGLVKVAKLDTEPTVCKEMRDEQCHLWQAIVDYGAAADLLTRVRWINYAVNELVAYRPDAIDRDDWKSGSETMRSMSGDCEDYALLKMKLLHAAGIPASQMAVVVVQGAWSNAYHAVVAVRIEGKVWILDNLSYDVVREENARDYRPMYAFNAERAWLYGAPASRPRVETVSQRSETE